MLKFMYTSIDGPDMIHVIREGVQKYLFGLVCTKLKYQLIRFSYFLKAFGLGHITLLSFLYIQSQ
jgi:hypothetical protein